jgi:hypothetical protein
LEANFILEPSDDVGGLAFGADLDAWRHAATTSASRRLRLPGLGEWLGSVSGYPPLFLTLPNWKQTADKSRVFQNEQNDKQNIRSNFAHN